MQKHLPQPDMTILLDIAPDVSARRKSADRDKYERDLALLGRVRDSYLRQAPALGGCASTPIATATRWPPTCSPPSSGGSLREATGAGSAKTRPTRRA